MKYAHNNLATALSPYLRQHADNPVWWQEWSVATLDHARAENKPLLVSVGYSTCHWCHVMASEAFSDQAVADLLNKNFVCIKVDREERPDIDSYLMNFLVAMNGSGGWPLNVFLTPELNPIFGLTYAPLQPRSGMPTFSDIIAKVAAFYAAGGLSVAPFEMDARSFGTSHKEEILDSCERGFDAQEGGFGTYHKFPPHSTLLFLLYASFWDEPRTKEMITPTLLAMRQRGLFDHLQGGLYRYCVDAAWQIPHFEKMLYDQALGLWSYSLSFGATHDTVDRRAAEMIIRSLEETFREGDLFIAAHDADTHHEEGATYLWTWGELQNVLTPDEFAAFQDVYDIKPTGNFEGANHLVRKNDRSIRNIEDKLLEIRRRRPQPFQDRKIMTSWNALTGCAYLQAFRYLGNPDYLKTAQQIARALWHKHVDEGHVRRCSLNGQITSGQYLEDHAALFVLITFLFEETGELGEMMDTLAAGLDAFRTGSGWRESANPDFREIPAGHFDHPTPSSVSLVEWAWVRFCILRERSVEDGAYGIALQQDAFNIQMMMRQGEFHVVHSPEKKPWTSLPLNSIQVRSALSQDCFKGACRRI